MSRHDTAQPSRLTPDDIAWQAAAVARGDRARAAVKRKERVARLACFAISIGLVFALFYSTGSY